MITHAGERNRVINFFWDTSWPPTIYARGYWQDNDLDPDEAAESIDGDLPAEAWRQLAVAFLS
ncbi:MAG: hypothetical protein AB7Q27_15570 [Acidimicrobiia bacterium]